MITEKFQIFLGLLPLQKFFVCNADGVHASFREVAPDRSFLDVILFCKSSKNATKQFFHWPRDVHVAVYKSFALLQPHKLRLCDVIAHEGFALLPIRDFLGPTGLRHDGHCGRSGMTLRLPPAINVRMWSSHSANAARTSRSYELRL